MNTLKTDLAIVGGGAAGLFAAAIAATRGIKCVVLEPNKQLGRKLRITGKGRCNLTNNCDVNAFLENVPVNPRFLYSAVNGFTPEDTIKFFESLGVPLKTERGDRVFPQSDKSHDIADALIRVAKKHGAKFLPTRADALQTKDGAITGVTAADTKIEAPNVILCTGGLSYPLTGSTGDGYTFATALGHTLISPAPSLVPLESSDDYCAEMQGFSLKNVSLSVYDDKNRLIFKELGEMIFTHFGVSGPLVLSASAHMRDFTKNHYRLSIDLKPGLDEKKLDARILRDFAEAPNRDFQNSLGALAARSMIPVLVRLSGIPAETKVNAITRAQRTDLVHLFKSFPVNVTGPRPIAEAIITSGGISTKEVNPKTMESKLIRGLYFAGEILDVDAYTGGFNLQIAWSTAFAAATAVSVAP